MSILDMCRKEKSFEDTVKLAVYNSFITFMSTETINIYSIFETDFFFFLYHTITMYESKVQCNSALKLLPKIQSREPFS